MEKMTNKKALEFVLGLEQVIANSEVKEKLEKMLEQNEKKSQRKSDKPSKSQQENIKVKEVMLEVLLEQEQPVQIKELSLDHRLADYSNQKLSALLRQMIAEGTVERVEEKRVAKFKVV